MSKHKVMSKLDKRRHLKKLFGLQFQNSYSHSILNTTKYYLLEEIQTRSKLNFDTIVCKYNCNNSEKTLN